ncbi:MAG: TerC family protein, partial [Gemmatimonadetes bacterium]|nr:TerC family protein [Gemmatimonadota bacterium]
MIDLLTDPGFWAALFSVTLIQVALGADNLIIITILANKLPPQKQGLAIQVGLILAMVFRIILLGLVSWLLTVATETFMTLDTELLPNLRIEASLSVKAIVLFLGGLILIWKGVKELRVKAKGLEEEVKETESFGEVVAVIVGMNLLFSVDSILTVVGMTEVFAVMVGSVVIS